MLVAIPLVGTGYRGTDVRQRVRAMRPGERVTLVREPSNAYDPKAVQVWTVDMMIGYLSAKENADVSAAIDRGGFLDQRTGQRAMNGKFNVGPSGKIIEVEI